MASNEHHHHHHGEGHPDYKKSLTVENIVLIVFGVLLLVLNVVFDGIAYTDFIGPVLYAGTGALGLSYIKYREDTYATLFKVFIWILIVFNIIAILYLSFILFFTGLLGASIVCQPGDFQCEQADDSLLIFNIILGISDLISVGVVVLMCFILSHFNKYESERKSHHYEKHHD